MEILTYVVDMQKHLLESSPNRKNAGYLLLNYYERIKDAGEAPASPQSDLEKGTNWNLLALTAAWMWVDPFSGFSGV